MNTHSDGQQVVQGLLSALMATCLRSELGCAHRKSRSGCKSGSRQIYSGRKISRAYLGMKPPPGPNMFCVEPSPYAAIARSQPRLLLVTAAALLRGLEPVFAHPALCLLSTACTAQQPSLGSSVEA